MINIKNIFICLLFFFTGVLVTLSDSDGAAFYNRRMNDKMKKKECARWRLWVSSCYPTGNV